LRSELALPGNTGGLERLAEWLSEYCERHAISQQACWQLNLALEELMVNAITHGQCSSEAGAIRITLEISGGEIVATISDDGIAFDPTAAEPPEPAGPLENRKTGGLGIHLARTFTRSIECERRGGRNIITLRKAL